MFILALLLGILAVPKDTPAEVRQTYNQLRAHAQRDADAQVNLALWCERNGLEVERLQHLSLALLADSTHPLARGLMGQVHYDGHWISPDDITPDAPQAETLAEYNRRRENLERTPDSHWRLAMWCARNGLKPEAEAHFTTVVRLDPRRADAWRKLGCKPYRGRWLNVEQIATQESDRKAQQKADRRWSTRLGRITDDIGNPRKAAAVEQAIAGIDDPRAVPTVWRKLATKGAEGQRLAVRVLGQINAPASSQTLAYLAVQADDPETRRAAAESLRLRDAREYLEVLILSVRKPLTYHVQPVDGQGSSPGVLRVEGLDTDLQRIYPAPELPVIGARPFFDPFVGLEGPPSERAALRRQMGISPLHGQFNPSVGRELVALATGGGQIGALATAVREAQAAPRSTRGTGLGNATFSPEFEPLRDEMTLLQQEARIASNLAAYREAVAVTNQRIERDIAEIDSINDAYGRINHRVLPVLHALTSENIGADPHAWASWWTDLQGYSYNPPQRRVVSEVLEAERPFLQTGVRASCFAAGTPVHARDGLRPIEQVQLGDQVLTIDPANGRLGYEPVVAVWHNKPDQTFCVRLDEEGDTITATGIHRFWVAGRGWVLVRDLKPGDPIRTRSGIKTVVSLNTDHLQPVFNLEVARTRSFLVGKAGALVHDYSLVETIDHPYDAVTTANTTSGK